MPPLPQNTATAAPSGPPLQTPDGTVLDPKVVKVMRAIRDVESQGDFNAVGDNGMSRGAYQWYNNGKPLAKGAVPENFKNAASRFGLDPNDFSPANQNKVAYHQIASYKAEGKQPEEIAALWNGAKKDPATGQFTYINPEYGEKFRAAIAGQASATPAATQSTPTPDQPGFLQSLYQGIAGPVVNMLARPGQAVEHLLGVTTPIEGDVFGGIHVNDPYADVSRGQSPLSVVTSDVGRGIQTAGLGLGAVAGGAAFGLGGALEHNKPLLPSLEHPMDNAIVQTALGGAAGKLGELAFIGLGKGLSLVGRSLETSAAAQSLIDSAAKNWETILAPTTKAFKAATGSIAEDLAKQGEVYTSRADFLNKAAAKAAEAGDVIDTIWNSIPEGTKVNVKPIGQFLMHQMEALQLKTPNGVLIPEENRALYTALDAKAKELAHLADPNGEVDVNLLRKWRQSGDAAVQRAKPYQFAASEGDRASTAATKAGTNAARKAINDNVPGAAEANKAYHLWDTAKDIMDATLLRKIGQGSSLTEKMNAAAGFVGGSTLGHAFSSALLLKYATRLLQSTLFQSAAAAFKVRLANAISSGDSSAIVQALLAIAKAGGSSLKFIGDFLQGLPGALKTLPTEDIPGTFGKAESNIKNIATGDALNPTGENLLKGEPSSPTTASKPSTAESISTGSAATGKEGVSARKADTSVPFDGGTFKVYHGTDRATADFSKDKPTFFTGSKEYASRYGDNAHEASIELKKPYVIDAQKHELGPDAEELAYDKEWVAARKAEGYDGMIVKDGGVTDYVVFSNKNIKSSPSIPKELEPRTWSELQQKNPELFNTGILRTDIAPRGAKGKIPADVSEAQSRWQNYGQLEEVPASTLYEGGGNTPYSYKGKTILDNNSYRDTTITDAERRYYKMEDKWNADTQEWEPATIPNERLRNELLDSFSTKEGQTYLKKVIEALPKNPDGSITAYRIGAIGGDGPQSYTLSEGMAKTFSHQGTDIIPGLPGRPAHGYEDFGHMPANRVKIDPKGIRAWSPYDAEILVDAKHVKPLKPK